MWCHVTLGCGLRGVRPRRGGTGELCESVGDVARIRAKFDMGVRNNSKNTQPIDCEVATMDASMLLCLSVAFELQADGTVLSGGKWILL